MHRAIASETPAASLQATDQLQTEFISVVSHELRTPVSAIQGYTDLLLDGTYGELNPEQREIMTYMKESAGGLMSMIDNLVSLSLMNRGQTDLVVRTIRLDDVIRDVLMTCRSECGRKKLSISHRIVPPDLCIRSDKIKLQQILTNLVVNAIRHTDAGSVRIEVRKLPADGDEPERIELEVRDTGCGIDEEHQQRVFERFYRVRPGVEGEEQGMGLGLHIVSSLVSMLGGSVRLASTPRQGSTFTVTLPAEFEEGSALHNLLLFNQQARVRDSGSAWLTASEERVVLFLGGDAARCQALSEGLPQEGTLVLPARDMRELVELLEARHATAIVLDPGAGSPNGGDVLRDLKSHPATRNLPVLFFLESKSRPEDEGPVETGRAQASLKIPHRPPGFHGNGRYCVLVVDDDAGMREALQMALESEGYNVALAEDGKQAVSLLEEQHPDLMLLDLMMPGLNGWQVIDILARKPELQRTKVLMLTGAALSAEEAESLISRTGGLLRKDDLKLNNILAGIASALGQR